MITIFAKRTLSIGLICLLGICLAGFSLTWAASNPGFLNESEDDIPAGAKTYQVWYTTDCDSDANCECDGLNDIDTSDPPDGTMDEDSPNDCIATVDSDADDIYDTGPDGDTDGVLNVADVDWVGGGTGVVEGVPRNVQLTLDRYLNDWGLKEPKWSSDTNRDIFMYDLGYYGLAFRNGSGIELDTEWMLTQAPEPRGTVLHELWHTTQYIYGADAGSWLMEGQARMLQDKVFDDLDNRVGSRYHNSVNTYLGNTTYVVKEDRDDDGSDEFSQAKGLFGASYNASLWWTYLAGQAGTQYAGTAGDGMDFMESVLVQSDDHGRQGKDAVNRVLLDSIKQGFDDTFWDFTVANYAKDYDLSLLDHDYLGGRDPEKVLKYSDEKRSDPDRLIYGPQYNDALRGMVRGVERQTFLPAELIAGVNGSVDALDSEVDDPDAMSPYGANYYEGILQNADCLLAYWRVIGDDGARFMHSWMLVEEDTNGDTEEEVISLLRSEGKDFARAIWNSRKSATTYTRMVGIVATGENPYGYDWEMGCTQPSINIVEPRTANPAHVGDPGDPGRFLLWLEVTGAGGSSTYVAGLEWDRDFAVTVGVDDADILNGGYVQNQYWLVVQAPDKPAASIGDKFDVTVELGPGFGISDTETQAVIYDIVSSDQVLVIDRSGSMADNSKLESAKTAARLFTDVKQKFDQIGVVSFSNDAKEEYALTPIPDQDDAAGIRAAAQAKINIISDDARTSIGDGLQKGQDLLNADGNPDNQWVMVLLSDGMENEPLYWSDVRAGVIGAGTRVHAIALGQDADEALMRDIAESTCGAVWVDECYHFIEESGVMGASAMASAGNISIAAVTTELPNALADIYRRSEESIAGHQRLWQYGGTLSGSRIINVVIEEDGAREAFFSFNWIDPGAPLNVTLTGPSGVSFINLTDGKTHTVFYSKNLPPGTYRVDISAPSGDSTWIGSLSGRLVHGTEFHAFLDNTRLQRRPGMPVRLQAGLTDDGGPVAGATVDAFVQRPDGTREVVHLVDDGGPYDDIAGDGIYGYVYDRINRPLVDDPLVGHTWIFDLYAGGVNNSGNAFERYKRLTYSPYMGRDQKTLDGDGDGMLDLWENRFQAASPLDPDDGDKDPDMDGLKNKEEFELGTNPDDPDTDRGGEIDGSEVAKKQNPLFTADDTIPPISDFRVENHPASVVLHFNPRPEYLKMGVFRRAGLVGSFSLVAEADPSKGEIPDKGLVNDQDYFYYIQPIGASNTVGRPSRVLYAEPAKDPYQPEGVVVINEEDQYTSSTNVSIFFQGLTLADGTRDVRHVQVSNQPDLISAPWKPFQTKMPWVIEPEPDTGLACIYVRFRDGAGNVSDTIFGDCIIYRPPVIFPAGLLNFGQVLADFRDPVFDGLTIIYSPMNYPGLPPGGDDLFFAGLGFDLEARDAKGQPVTQFEKPFTLSVHYEDWQWESGGIKDEESLNLYWNSGRQWVPLFPCKLCSRDLVRNTFTVQLDHLSEFALLGPGIQPDMDHDGIPDSWERDNFGDLTTADATTDYDNDGLLDIDEQRHNTDPKDTDTDNDGMPDGWEVRNGLNPGLDDSDADTDRDGYSSIAEYQAGSDPNDPESFPLYLTIPLFKGFNMISSPANTHYIPDAYTFLGLFDNDALVERVYRYNRETEQVEEAYYGKDGQIEGDNFPMVGGEGLIIVAREDTSLTMTQNICTAHLPEPGVNWVGTPCQSPVEISAFMLLEAGGGETIPSSIQRYNPVSGMFETAGILNNRPVGVDFPIRPGEGYLIYMQ